MPHRQRRIQDIVPPHKKRRFTRRRGIRERSRSRGESAQSTRRAAAPSGATPPRPPRRIRVSRFVIWGGAIAAVVLLGLAVSLFFSQSKIVVTPQQKAGQLDAQFAAVRGSERAEGNNAIPFEVMVLDEARTKQVQATKVKQVERRASGTIVVYNDYSEQGQRLIKNTRFEAPDGKIYRIRESIIVPGQTTKDGETVPGSTEVTVYADEPGEEYNKDRTDFTIPGFEGTPRYDAFYARSQEPLSGGFSGVVKTVPEEKAASVRDGLRSKLKQTLLAKAEKQVPDGFALFEDTAFFEFSGDNEPETEDTDSSTVTVSEEATLYGVMLDKEVLSRHVAGNLLDEQPDASVAINNLSALSLTIKGRDAFDPTSDTTFSFSLSGTPQLVWLFDHEQLRQQLAGAGEGAIDAVLTQFPSIEEADIVLRPFWRRSFPDSPQDITIETFLEP